MDLRNGLDELKGIVAARPTAKVFERECSILSVIMSDNAAISKRCRTQPIE